MDILGIMIINTDKILMINTEKFNKHFHIDIKLLFSAYTLSLFRKIFSKLWRKHKSNSLTIFTSD